MNYGSSKLIDFELQGKYFPSSNTFIKSFCGESFKFEGFNIVKSVSNIHDCLNEL